MSRRCWVLATLCAVVAMVLSGCGSDDGTSARAYISSHYARAPKLDEPNDGRAYTANKTPTAVADEITKASRPLDRRTSGSLTFLQYRDDIIAISPYGSGAEILVDDYRTGHRRHYGFIGVFGWPSDNSGFRGGGPGDGK